MYAANKLCSLARVTWRASLAAFCKGGTKSPPSPLCVIMLIMDSNSIIAGNECKSIVLSSRDDCKKTWRFFSSSSVTHTKDSLMHLQMTHYPRRRCEKCSLIWKLQKWMKKKKNSTSVLRQFYLCFTRTLKSDVTSPQNPTVAPNKGGFPGPTQHGKVRFFLASNVSLSSHRPLYNFIEAPLWEGHNSSLLWVESAWQKGDARQFLGIVNYPSRTWCRTARLTSGPYGEQSSTRRLELVILLIARQAANRSSIINRSSGF